MTISKDYDELTSRGRFPDRSSPPIAHSYGALPTYASAAADYDKEMGWDLLDILDGIEDFQQDEMGQDSLDRLIRKYRSKTYGSSYEPNPLGFQTAIRAASVAANALFSFRDTGDYESQSEAILAVDEFVAHLAALTAGGLLEPSFYKKGYQKNKYRSNPTETDNTPLLNAMFKIITAYRTTYAGFISEFNVYAPRNIQTYFINEASNALANAARTSKGSFLLTDNDFAESVMAYLDDVTKAPDDVSRVLKDLFYAKGTLAEMIGGGFSSKFWYESMWEEVTASFSDY